MTDYTLRSTPRYPMTPEQRAALLPPERKLEDVRAELEGQIRPHEVVRPGIAVEIERLIKRNKTGGWPQNSTLGKLLERLDEDGIPYQAGESEYFSGDAVVPVNIKVEGRQTPMTIDYKIKPGKNVIHRWLDFPFRGSRATLVGSVVSWRGHEYSIDEWKEQMDAVRDDQH